MGDFMDLNKLKELKYPILIAVLALVFFWKMFFFPSYTLFSPFSDLTSQDFFWKRLIHDSFQKYNELPLWNPYTFSGMPFLAHHFSKILYPANLLFLIFPNIEVLFNYIYFFHFILAGLFLYLFARQIGLDKFSSFTASIIYIFNLRVAATLVYAGLSNELPLFAFLPAALYFFELSIRKSKFVYSILMGISLAFIMLGVHTQFIVYSYAFLLFYFMFRLLIIYKSGNGNSLKRAGLFFAAAIAISILLSAVQLLPSIELLKYDTRSSGISYEYAASPSFPPYHLITAIIPNFFGSLLHNNYWSLFPFWQFSIYVGILPLILLLFSFRKRSPFVLFFAAIAVFSMIFALGRHIPFHYILYKFVPLVNKFRVPTRILFFYILSVSIIAGFGVDYLVKIKSRLDKIFLKKVIVTLVILAILSTATFFGVLLLKKDILSLGDKLLESKYGKSNIELGLRPLVYYKEKIKGNLLEIQKGILIFIAILLGIITLLFLWLKNLVDPAAFRLLIAFLIIFDLWLFSMPFIDVKSLDLVYTQKNIPSFLNNDKGYFRVLDLTNALPQETAIRYNLKLVNGYDPMILGYYREYVSEMAGIPFIPSTIIPIKEIKHHKMLGLLNAKYIITDKKLKNSRYELVYNSTVFVYTNNEKKFYSDKELNDELFEFSKLQINYVYKNKDAFPRAFVVGNYMVTGRDKILDILKSNEFDSRKYVILEENGKQKSSNDIFKEAEISFYSQNKIIVDVDINEPGFLILSEIWYPGWKAFDNGEETKIYRANFMFRSVYLDKGKHEIEFVFEPLTYRVGLWVSLITVILIALYFMIRVLM